jgi:2-keto-3-deoxy-L-rhamnonate aldolase RhmA
MARSQAGILAGIREARADFGVSALLIPSIDREAEASSAMEMVEMMLAHPRSRRAGDRHRLSRERPTPGAVSTRPMPWRAAMA